MGIEKFATNFIPFFLFILLFLRCELYNYIEIEKLGGNCKELVTLVEMTK